MNQSSTYFFRTLLIAILALTAFEVFATHNRAGEITYVQDPNEPFTIIATITTYTKASSETADRDSLEICWGDGNCEFVLRNNGQGDLLPNDTKINRYIATHLYPGPGHFIISMQDPNRNGGILNVNPPNSDNIEFFLQSTVTLFPSQFQTLNNSPVLLQPPIDVGCVGQRFIHNPNAYDTDGDSLSYKLIVPKRDVNTDVPLYQFPNQINEGADNSFFFSEVTGEFIWDAPQREGEYNIAMYIIEYRNGLPLDTMIRDMQILIQACNNIPPEIETIDELCVVAGELVQFDVIGTDPDIPIQRVEISALGGPFEVEISPAEFDAPEGFQDQPVIGTFRWQTTCEHISDQFYTVVFKAVDEIPNDGNAQNTSLATLKTVRIKVVGPPPLDVQAVAIESSVFVSWESPYVCENAADDYFKGFTVWRREGSNPFEEDDCRPGLEGRGYTQITFQTREVVDGRYQFEDTDVDRGKTFCYRVLAEFARISPGGNQFNLVESLPSEEVCLQLNRDLPLITHVDVNQTDAVNGEIIVQWAPPDAEDLDTLLNPGPYVYEVWRAEGITQTGFQPVPGGIVTSQTLTQDNIMFLDEGLNTLENPYSYQIAFFTNGDVEPLGFTSEASSIYLDIFETDEENELSWTFDVPWKNFEYVIHRRDPGATNYDSIGITIDTLYEDKNLINGEEYCYFIEARGSYGVDGVISPLINRSQEKCGVPVDNVPPCPPELSVSNICDSLEVFVEEDLFENLLIWTNPNVACVETDDVESYNVFYAEVMGADLELIATVSSAGVTEYVDVPENGVAGCYAVTAIDANGNESELSNIVCVDNCPLYLLPNVFTPNNDGSNDAYVPINQRFIERIDMQIFNRWGNLVHQNTDPEINWNGTNLNGEDLSEGVYFYVCKVFERRVNGVILSEEVKSGFIELRRGN